MFILNFWLNKLTGKFSTLTNFVIFVYFLLCFRYSGADLAGIAKNAAKIAIRMQIQKEIATRKEAELQGKEYDAEEKEDKSMSMITQEMLIAALKECKRSVSPQEYQKYLHMKNQFDRESVCFSLFLGIGLYFLIICLHL